MDLVKMVEANLRKGRYSSQHKLFVVRTGGHIGKAMKSHKKAMAAHADAVDTDGKITQALGRVVDHLKGVRKGATWEEGGAEEETLFHIHDAVKAYMGHHEKRIKFHKAIGENQGDVYDQQSLAASSAEEAMGAFDEPEPATAKRYSSEPYDDATDALIREQARSMGLDQKTIFADPELKRRLLAKVFGGQLTRPGVFARKDLPK